MRVAGHQRFVYHRMVNVETKVDLVVSGIASGIGEPARARMLYTLMDGHARTSTELAAVAEVSPSTASAHLNRLKAENLVKVVKQGKHRYYALQGPDVSRVLEGLSVLAGGSSDTFVPNTPSRLRTARTCYDHIAGTLGVLLHERFLTLGWLRAHPGSGEGSYDVTAAGRKALAAFGIDIDATQAVRRRFAYGCLDWSERRDHLGGALGAALLRISLRRQWVTQELGSRELNLTRVGRREMLARFGLELNP